MIDRMTTRLLKRGNRWYVEIDRKRRSLDTADEAEARRLYKQIRKEYLSGKLASITGECVVTLADFAGEFDRWSKSVQPHSTYRAGRLALSKLIDVCGPSTRLDRITLKHMDNLVMRCKDKGLSNASINNYMRHARAALNKAVAWGHIKDNPLAKAKELSLPRKQPQFLSKSEAVRFIASIEDVELRRMVVAYIATGRRRSELLALAWEDVDLEKGQYLIRKSKNHMSKWYPVNGIFRAVLEQLGVRTEGRVFQRWEHPDTVSHAVKEALVKAGFGGLRLHDLRHTFASLQVMAGRDLRTVQELLGHTEYRTTEIYAHLTDEHIKDSAEIFLGPIDLGGGFNATDHNERMVGARSEDDQ